jgi:hypothetical protein
MRHVVFTRMIRLKVLLSFWGVGFQFFREMNCLIQDTESAWFLGF